MKRFATQRYGFFSLAAIVCAALTFVIDPEHRWVSLGTAGLYALLAVLFLLEELSRPRG